MKPTLYHYTGCGTCKKARAFLARLGVEVEAIDLVEKPPTQKKLAEIHARSGLSIRKLFNVSGQSYRAGGFKEKLETMSEKEAIAALAADGKLIKRPILVTEREVLVGFDEARWKAALGA